MNKVDISCSGIDSPAWLVKLESVCLKILDIMRKKDWEVSILLCNDSYIRKLNKQYRGIDRSTDVLSFSQNEDNFGPDLRTLPENYIAGDIIISVDTLENNCEQYNIKFEEELGRLVIHGLLHLAGFEHKSTGMDDAMICMQENILNKIKEEKVF